MEKSLSQLESEIAPILRNTVEQRALPQDGDFDTLIGFVALMFTRVPWFRATISDAFAQVARHIVDLETAVPEHWAGVVSEAKRKSVNIEITREEMREVLDNDKYRIGLSQNYSVGMMLAMTQKVYPVLRARSWCLVASDDADSAPFVTSDNPVSLVSTVPTKAFWGPGLAMENTELVLPLDKGTCLVGAFEKLPSRRIVGSQEIAQINGRTATGCDRFLYTPSEDFAWVDPTGRLGNKTSFVGYANEAKKREKDGQSTGF